MFSVHCLTLKHASVGRFRNGVDMRWHFVPFLAPVHLNDVLWVYGEVFVGVYNHTEEAWVCLQTNRNTNNKEKCLHYNNKRNVIQQKCMNNETTQKLLDNNSGVSNTQHIVLCIFILAILKVLHKKMNSHSHKSNIWLQMSVLHCLQLMHGCSSRARHLMIPAWANKITNYSQLKYWSSS